MLSAEEPTAYRLITQADHSRQVGAFARAWGNEQFEHAEPRASLVLAAELHDNGWWETDLGPRLAGDAPAGVRDVPASDWTAMYERAVDRVAALDPYAAVLVSMHGTGIRRQRYGLAPSMPEFHAEFAEFVDAQESRQRALLERAQDGDVAHSTAGSTRAFLSALHATGSYESVDEPSPSLWTQYALLQAWDQLSLHLCRNATAEATTIEPVPLGGELVAVDVEPVAENAVRLDPYPFETSPLAVPVTGRTIPRRAYTEASLRAAYYDASVETFEFEVRGHR